MPHKLAPRSSECVLLGYPDNHKGYRCLDLSTNHVIISRHVVFDENNFPFAANSPAPLSAYDFLDVTDEPMVLPDHIAGHTAEPSVVTPSTATVAASDPGLVAELGIGAPNVDPTTAPSDTIGATRPDQAAHTSAVPGTSPTSTSTLGVPTNQPQLPQITQMYSQRSRAVTDHQQSTSAPSTSSASTASQRSSRAPIVPIPPVVNAHTMTTRGKQGISQPKQILDLSVINPADVSPLPKTYRGALSDPNWNAAMVEEFSALTTNQTWDLVAPPPHANIVSGKWLFRHKLNSDGTLARYKARWVVRGFSQQPGLDYDETFSLVVKPTTIRTVLSLAVAANWPIHQLDVKNAFLHGTINETVYCQQPPGFVDTSRPNYVCRLNKALYGLKQAPRAWYSRFQTFILSLGFQASQCDTSLFIYKHGGEIAYLLLYVDDIILTASSSAILQQIITSLSQEFAMTDLGTLHYFLGVSARRSATGLFLCQSKFAAEILERAKMTACNPCATPIEARSKLSSTDGPPVSDPSLYRSLVGAL